MHFIRSNGAPTISIQKRRNNSSAQHPPLSDLSIAVATPLTPDHSDLEEGSSAKDPPSDPEPKRRLTRLSSVAELGKAFRGRSASGPDHSPRSATFPRDQEDTAPPSRSPSSPLWVISRPDISSRHLSVSSSGSGSKKTTAEKVVGALSHFSPSSVGNRSRQVSSTELDHSITPISETLLPSRSASHSMASVQMRPGTASNRPPGTAHSNMNFSMSSMGSTGTAGQTGATASPLTIAQHIHDMASKRISTLDYLRKAHEGRIYWFNTILFTTLDLSKLPYFAPAKLARRATAYVLLGFSLPALLDLNGSSAPEYLRALNALLSEFDSFLEKHGGSDGSGSGSGFGGSLSKGRMQQMFKRGMQGVSKGRRASAATDTVWAGIEGAAAATSPQDDGPHPASTPLDPHPETYTIQPATSTSAGADRALSGAATPFHPHASPFDLAYAPALTGAEHHAHLLVVPLPFPPDYYQAFSTLCDCLIDVYTRIMDLVPSPEALLGREREGSIAGGSAAGNGIGEWRESAAAIGELFAKADSRVKKLLVAGVVREFEEASRSGVRGEMRGVGRVVLGGLM